jgi:hypothetical protein
MKGRIMQQHRTVLAYTMNLNGTPEQVFPLLCPVREYEWIPSWKCTVVHSVSGVAELDCIFKTDFPEDGPEDTWVVSRYEPAKAIEFVRVNPLRAIHFTIHCVKAGTSTSQWVWTQTVTGLNAEGNALVKGMTQESHTARRAALEKMLNHFLETGKMLES